jgi:methyltransferase (TIGR00027 family)
MVDPAPARNSSRTALGVATLRAVHHIVDGQPKILEDPIAARLLDPETLDQIQNHPARAQEPWAKGLRSHVILRSRFAEDRLAGAVHRGVHQCVILGAGFDTFAYRQPDWAHSLRIYEVDHRATQEEKRQRLQSAGVAIPSNLEFVAVDFESVSLRQGLQASTLNFSEATFFSCLGVLVYLTPEAAHAIFQLVAGFPAPSEIVFTFSPPVSSLSTTEAELRATVSERVNALGEPWQTYFDPHQLIDDLRSLGFSSIDSLDPEAAERIYFQNRTDGLRAPRRGGIVAAVVGHKS